MKKLHSTLLLALLSIAPWSAHAQRGLRIDSDRPGFGQTPITVGKHYLQMQVGQQGGWLSGTNLGNSSFAEGNPSQTNLLLRFGLSNRTEMQLGASRMGFNRTTFEPLAGANLIDWAPGNYFPNSYNGRWNNLQLGLRHTFMDETQNKPFSLGFIGNYTHQASADYSRQRDMAGHVQLGLLGSKILSHRVSALGNIGVNQPIGVVVPRPNPYYLVHFDFDLGKNLYTFFETRQDFLTSDGGGNVSMFNTGLSWRLTPNFQFDVFGGYVRTDMLVENPGRNTPIIFPYASREHYWFVGGGVSWKIKALPSKPAKTD